MSICKYQGDAEEVVQNIMLSYLNDNPGCKTIDRFRKFEKDTISIPEYRNFKVVGHINQRLLGLVQYIEVKNSNVFYKLHYVDKNGMQEVYEPTQFNDSLKPLAIAEDIRIMLDKREQKCYIQRNKKEIVLPVDLSDFLMKAGGISSDKLGSLKPFIIDNSFLYTYVPVDRRTKLLKVSLKNGKAELITENAATPRIAKDYLYFMKIPTDKSKKAMMNAGMMRSKVNSSRMDRLFDARIADALEFNGMIYVPVPASNEMIYQVKGWGNSFTASLDSKKIQDVNFNTLEEAIKNLQDYEDSLSDQGIVVAEVVEESAVEIAQEAQPFSIDSN